MGVGGGVSAGAPRPDVALRRSLWAGALGLLVTSLILLTPYLTFGVRSSAAHLALNAVDALIALLVAYLLHGRFLRSRLLRDVLLSQALILLALSGLGADLLALLGNDVPADLESWVGLALRLLGAAYLAAAALAGDRTVAEGRYERWPLWLLVTVVVAVVGGLGLVADGLPAAIPDADLTPDAQRPLLTGHPALLAVQALSAVGFALAAVVFTVEGRRRDDELMRWLGPACVLGVFARFNYLLFPSLYTDWLYTGDLLRTGTYLLLLVGAAREIQQYWQAESRLAVLEERRRHARELHDGVVQELGYIRSEALLHGSPDGPLARIVEACDRALDEARAAVHLLGSTPEEALADTLERSLRQLAERYDVPLVLDLDPDVVVPDDQRHAVLRIAREAVGNAARHARARSVRVTLRSEGEQRVLCIADDGRGFAVGGALARGTTYGLTSMRDRAHGMSGRLAVQSTPGDGTTVTLTW